MVYHARSFYTVPCKLSLDRSTSVIAEFRIPSADFELGRILHVEGVSTVELESLVPIGDATVPLFWIHNATRDSFVETVRRHPAVNDTSEVDVFEDRTLFTLDWDASQNYLFQAIQRCDGQVLGAVGTPDRWDFEIRFPTHDDLTGFTTDCEDAGIGIEATRVYNPAEPEEGRWYGLTAPQREALVLAVEMGYYAIPRGCTTEELAEELGISDQAVTERLRRAIATLVESTLAATQRDR